METVLELFGQAPAWLTALLSLMVGAKAIVALTPTPKDDELVGKIYGIIEFLALNFGKAKDIAPNRVVIVPDPPVLPGDDTLPGGG
ncbi:MAG: hypothetical protein COB09_16890 [Thalassobium sp.]|nr:MAG: hypothetical protein COB09_16890 [Thalassobium sp.]